MSNLMAFFNKFNLHKWSIDSCVLGFQNLSLLLLSTSVFTCITYFNYLQLSTCVPVGSYEMFETLLPYIGIHAIADSFVVKGNDLRLHHLFILVFLFYNWFYQVDIKDKFPILYCLLKTEISSIFYVLKFWLTKNTWVYHVNSVLFYLGFLKFRIFDFYMEIVRPGYIFDVVFKYSHENLLFSIILVVSIYGLYMLNLYWFLIINKIVYKQISKVVNIDRDDICHHLCSYLLFFNIPVACYVYSYNKGLENSLIDMVGICGLSVTSFIYHNDIYKRLKMNHITSYTQPLKDNIVLLFNDVLMIHVRSFLTTMTCYYYSTYNDLVIVYSGLFHTASIYGTIVIILKFYIKDNETNSKATFFFIHSILIIIPIAVDVILVCLNSTFDVVIPLLVVSILIALLFITNPFYKLSHVAFHFLLVVQTYYLCISNISAKALKY